LLKQVAKAYPRRKLHIVCDNYGGYKHPNVQACCSGTRASGCTSPEPRGSWLNMVEIFDHHPPSGPPRHLHLGPRLIDAIRAFIGGWNDRCEPFAGTKTADELLEHSGPVKERRLRVPSVSRVG
jgi:hypothetical protein